MSSGANEIQLRELRDTILQLNNTINTQNALILSLQKMLEESDAKRDEKDQLIANLRAQLDYHKTKVFGSTSEMKKDVFPGQLSLFADEVSDDEKTAIPLEPEFVEIKAHTRERKKKATYDELFEGIKTTRVTVEPLSEEKRTCPECGTLMIPIGTEIVRTEIIYHEPSLERIEYVATSYRCPNFLKEEETIIVKDECRPSLIQGSYVSESLATHVMYAKYMMANPLYRQEQDFLHLGAKIGRGTMANWIIRCSQDYLVNYENSLPW